jgi:hypothetical protein
MVKASKVIGVVISDNSLRFLLERTDSNKNDWAAVLGRHTLSRATSLSILPPICSACNVFISTIFSCRTHNL